MTAFADSTKARHLGSQGEFMQQANHLVTPKAPATAWLHSYVAPSLPSATPYKIDTMAAAIKLDQNESPWDLPVAIKQKVLNRLMTMEWNRYPSAFADEIAEKIASSAGFAPGTVLLGPGSNYLVALILTTFGKGIMNGQGTLVVARPSFPLYESHSRYEGIPYSTWDLNADLEYDVNKLPPLARGSIVMFASPNNPVGNVLPRQTLIELLERFPDTLFVADEAYFEYASEPYADLLAEYSNLLLLRTFSKTMGCAGVRLGYVVGHEQYLHLLRKPRLPFLLNHFTLACADVLLSDEETKTHLQRIRENALEQRDRVYVALKNIGQTKGFFVKDSSANFLLLRWPDKDQALAVYAGLIKAGILVRNVGAAPSLAGCLRVTIGDERENEALIAAMSKL
ncbi:MAG: histidinol-phosphate aminotransferase family protein [Deltaproteobacteria bacterium]|nr:histidinol-phosphate aminotransferase family protein [Deltaproteobacteria bacterium]